MTASPIETTPGTPVPYEDGSRIATPVLATIPAEPGGETIYIREAGIQFTLPAPGGEVILYNRVTFDLFTKEPNLQLTLSWEIIF